MTDPDIRATLAAHEHLLIALIERLRNKGDLTGGDVGAIIHYARSRVTQADPLTTAGVETVERVAALLADGA